MTVRLPAHPGSSSPEASARMAAHPSRDTGPELAVRRELHRRGYRYRVERKVDGLPRRRTDLAFPRERVAVFVDGCYWHACPEHGRLPTANAGWWAAKLARNVERDAETSAHLAGLGWLVVRAWEHEDPLEVADRVEAAVLSRR